MESLAAELIMDILSRVPTPDLPKLRYVCKRWKNALKDPLFHRLHCSHYMFEHGENHVLILKRGSELYIALISDKTNPRQIPIDLPNFPYLSYYEFIGSCNGLLCMGSQECMWVFIINPFTRQQLFFTMNLSTDWDSVLSWGFGFDEVTKSFKLVAVVENRVIYGEVRVRVCDLGSDGSTNWRDIGVTAFRTKNSACFFNGRLHWTYWADGSMGIVSFDLADEEFRPVPVPDDLHGNIIDFDLIVLGKCLCIFNSQGSETPKLRIWVMKEYGVKESWVKELDARPRIPGGLDYQLNFDQRGGLLFYQDGGRFFKGLGCLKDGELVVSKSRSRTQDQAILFSDSICDEFKLLRLDRPPYRNGAIIHTLTLNWI